MELIISKHRKETIIEAVVAELLVGGIVLFPFDTSYGLMADALNTEAVDKIYKIKSREGDKALSVVVSGLEMAKKYCDMNEVAVKQFNKYFPGKYTLVLNVKPETKDLITSKNNTQAIRVPDNKLLIVIAKKLDKPFTATSANLSRQPNCYSVEAVKEQMGDTFSEIDLVCNGGELPTVKPSAIIDLSTGGKKILR